MASRFASFKLSVGRLVLRVIGLFAHRRERRIGAAAKSMRAVAALVAMMTLICVGLAGCDMRYIAHAAYEEGRLLWHRKPISQVLTRPDLSAETRAKLETVLAVRKFAADKLGENVGGAYSTVTPVDAGAIVWVVMAAKRDQLVPYTWWFPVVGSVPYRGYFDKSAAEAEARSLETQGYDIYVRPAVAFSSLGFFNDPLLSNLLALDRVELTGVIIHELFHRTFFLASDAMFDESAATWVGARGALQFFVDNEGADSADAASARGVLESELRFADFLGQEQARLLQLYQSGLPEHEILKRRVKIFSGINSDYAALKPTLSGLERYDLDKQKLNNAVLLNYLIYFHDLRNFEALYRLHHCDLRVTIKAIITLARSEPDDPFHAIWRASLAARPATSPLLPEIPYPLSTPAH